jgi:exodeoxyribonuclease V alpha subunit
MSSDLRVIRDTGALAEFHAAGVLDAADVHVALRITRLAAEPSPFVLLAAALTVRAARLGAVCVPLADLANVTTDLDGVDLTALPWPDPAHVETALRASTLLTPADGCLAPLRLADTSDGPLLYLDRYFRQELTIRRVLTERAARPLPTVDARVLADILNQLFHDPGDPGMSAAAPDRQRIATAVAATEWTSFITGGPGTGKTHTVARILIALHRLHRGTPRVALAAPTGKAAARLTESINTELPDDIPELAAVTVHRLLGWRRGDQGRYAYHSRNRLPYDILIIDETSMMSLTMTARLLDATTPHTRLVFLGDPDQLASIDAGAVLADIVASSVLPPAAIGTTTEPSPAVTAAIPTDLTTATNEEDIALTDAERARLGTGRIRLTRGRRYGGAIDGLARALHAGDTTAVLDILTAGTADVSWTDLNDLDGLRTDIHTSGHSMTQAALAGDTHAALNALGQHRLLCAHRTGSSGVSRWDDLARNWVHTTPAPDDSPEGWYAGQPLLVTGNDYDTGVYNGDTGVIIRQDNGSLIAAFERGAQPVQVPTSRLNAVETAYAMTIHRAQGSQYQRVSIVLPPPTSALLSRQLLYTAITRGIEHVRLLGTQESVEAAVARQVPRASGLRSTLLGVTGPA